MVEKIDAITGIKFIREQIHETSQAMLADPLDRFAINTALQAGFRDPDGYLRAELKNTAEIIDLTQQPASAT